MSIPINEPVKSWLIKTNYNCDSFALCPATGMIAYQYKSMIDFVSAKTGMHFPDGLCFEGEIETYGWSQDGTRFYVAIHCTLHCYKLNERSFEKLTDPIPPNKPNAFSARDVGEFANGHVFTLSYSDDFLKILDTEHKLIFEHQIRSTAIDIVLGADLVSLAILIYLNGIPHIESIHMNDDGTWSADEPIYGCPGKLKEVTKQQQIISFVNSDIYITQVDTKQKMIQLANKAEVCDIHYIDEETIIVATEDPNYVLVMRIPDGKILLEISGFQRQIVLLGFFGDNQYLVTGTSNKIPFESYADRDLYMQVFDFGSPNLGRGDSSVFNPLPV